MEYMLNILGPLVETISKRLNYNHLDEIILNVLSNIG